MDSGWAAIIGAVVGGAASIAATWLSEHIRERRTGRLDAHRLVGNAGGSMSNVGKARGEPSTVKPRDHSFGWLVAFGVGVVVVVFLCWWFTPAIIVAWADPGDQGVYGDQYGAVNALFSGLAFAAVFFALLFQYRQLKINQMETRENRDALDKTISTQAFKTAVDILQTEDAINARRLVLEKLEGRDPSDWTDEEVRQAEIVCRTYDVVGSMIGNAMMPESYIVEP